MIKTYPTLYKKTNTGKIQVWFVEQNSDKYRTTSGQLDGKKVTSEWTVALPKNTGKNNATTGEQQATAEIEAMYVKQRKRDYRDSVDQVDTITRFKPMLAEKWADCKNNIADQLVFIQAKLDGCLHGNSIIELDGISITISDLYRKWLSSSTTEIPNIKTYNEITGEDEYKDIKAVIKNGIDIREKSPNWYKIKTDNGKELILNGNPRVWVDNLKCWRRVDELDGTEILKNSI